MKNKILLLSAFIVFSISTVSSQESYVQKVPGSSYEIKMVPIPSGNFLMGSASTEKGRRPDEGPQKKVQLSAFWIGAYEITHDQFGIFYKDETTSQGSKTDAVTRPTAQYIDLSWNMGKEGGFPVNSMSVDGALMFCRWLYQ
ncbi:MAG: formylglycine-generating enzyme family protein, partial [Chitinophagaceae bacterium]